MKRFLLFFLLALCALTNVAQAQVGVVRSSGVYSVQKAKPQDLGPLTRNGNVYYYHDEPMTQAQMVEFIKKDCQQAYNYYRKQHKIEMAGWALFGVGAALCLGIGVPVQHVGENLYYQKKISKDERYPYFASGLAFTCVGAITWILVGTPMIIAGNIQKKNAHKQYNTWCGYKELEQSQAKVTPLELKLTSGTNGLGLALSF